MSSLRQLLRDTIGVISREEAEQTYQKKIIAKAAEQTTGKVLPHGGDRKSEQAESRHESCLDSQKERARQAGVSYQTQQRLDRLARDFPPLHEEVKEGRLSVNRASIQAGFVREATALDLLKRDWRRATRDNGVSKGLCPFVRRA